MQWEICESDRQRDMIAWQAGLRLVVVLWQALNQFLVAPEAAVH